MDENFKNIVIIILTGISTFFAWFLKKIYAEHSLVFEYYTKNKDLEMHKILLDIETIKSDIPVKIIIIMFLKFSSIIISFQNR